LPLHPVIGRRLPDVRGSAPAAPVQPPRQGPGNNQAENGADAGRPARQRLDGLVGERLPNDVMEFLIAGAGAVQLGTVNFYDPTASVRIAGQLPEDLTELGASNVREVVGTLRAP